MLNDKLIDDLFEAARKEPVHRSLKSVEQFVQTTAASTSTSLIVKWLKLYKMNILISTSSVIVAAAFIFFPKQEAEQTNLIPELNETPEVLEEVVTERDTMNEELAVVSETNEVFDENIEVAETKAEVLEESLEEENLEKEYTKYDTVIEDRGTQEIEPKPIAESQHSEAEETNKLDKGSKPTKHSIALESRKGNSSARKFELYLTNHLPQLKHEFSCSVTNSEVKKFSLKLDNRY
ncbi:MAG: hypothetical protein AAF391_07395, partial [Bacteroidota bacterium]